MSTLTEIALKKFPALPVPPVAEPTKVENIPSQVSEPSDYPSEPSKIRKEKA